MAAASAQETLQEFIRGDDAVFLKEVPPERYASSMYAHVLVYTAAGPFLSSGIGCISTAEHVLVRCHVHWKEQITMHARISMYVHTYSIYVHACLYLYGCMSLSFSVCVCTFV
jgi:hypothetical protein